MESQKRVLIVTQYFYPENFRINELAYELVKDGYVVDALVGKGSILKVMVYLRNVMK